MSSLPAGQHEGSVFPWNGRRCRGRWGSGEIQRITQGSSTWILDADDSVVVVDFGVGVNGVGRRCVEGWRVGRDERNTRGRGGGVVKREDGSVAVCGDCTG